MEGKATQSMSMTTTVKGVSERMEELIAALRMRTSCLEVYPAFRTSMAGASGTTPILSHKTFKKFFYCQHKKILFYTLCGRFSGTHVIKQDAIYVCSCNLKINNIEKNSPLNKVNSSVYLKLVAWSISIPFLLCVPKGAFALQ